MPFWGVLPKGDYAPVYTNRDRLPVGIRAVAARDGVDPSFDGAMGLSLSGRAADQVTELTYTQPSEVVWLLPNKTLYALHVSPGNLVGTTASVRFLLFEPSRIERAVKDVGDLLILKMMGAGKVLPVTSVGPIISVKNYLEISL